jgi:hypothetical protein
MISGNLPTFRANIGNLKDNTLTLFLRSPLIYIKLNGIILHFKVDDYYIIKPHCTEFNLNNFSYSASKHCG